MKSDFFKKLLKRLPPGISINLPGFSIDPSALARYLSESTSTELVEFAQQVSNLRRDIAGSFQRLQSDLAGLGVTTEKQYRSLLTTIDLALRSLRHPQFPLCFLPAADVFSALIARNFLLEFAGPNSDYLQLLSDDLRRVFFSVFNRNLRSGKINRMAISGWEGSGKTFNTLLLSLQLSNEGYEVFYCPDIRNSNLTLEGLHMIATMDNESTIWIIDNIHHDPLKAESLITAISRASSYLNKPLFLFLTRPLDKDTFLDIFGRSTPILSWEDKFIDFERLVSLFFQSRGVPQATGKFLEKAATCFPDFLIKYRNMAFWNEVLRSLDLRPSWDLTEKEVLKRAHAFFRRKEPYLLKLREPLAYLLPLLRQGIPIVYKYACEVIGEKAEEALQELKRYGIIRIVEIDWETDQYDNTNVLAITSGIHVTTAKLLSSVFQQYYDMPEPTEAIADYAERFLHNLYYILTPYWNPDELRFLFKKRRICAIVRRYFIGRHLGKKLDRVIRRLAILDEATLNFLFDPEVMEAFAQRVNSEGPYIVSKMYLFRSLYRVSPRKAYELFCLIKPEAVTQTFLADATKGGVTSLAKWMEVFKNVYYYASTPEDKEKVRLFVKEVIDQCWEEFIRRFETRHKYFTQLHWMLKRLHGLKLANYFLGKIPPEKLIELIRTKDTNVVELCRYVLLNARYTPWIAPNGSRQRYYDIIRDNLTYDDLKRIFNNPRSDLYDLTINATHDFVAKALVRYADDTNFRQKVVEMAKRNPYLLQKSLGLINTNYFLTDKERAKLVTIIKTAAG